MSPFSFTVTLGAIHLDALIAAPAVVTKRHFESGMVEAGTPLLRIVMDGNQYDLRIRFPCYISVDAAEGDTIQPGVTFAAGGADGESLPEGFRYLTMHAVPADTNSG